MSLGVQNPARAFGLASLAGVLVALSTPPRVLPGLPFFFAPVLALALEEALASRAPVRASAAVGLVAGSSFGLVALPWVAPLLASYAHAPAPLATAGFLLCVLAEALPVVLATTLVAWVRPGPLARAVVLPAAIAVSFTAVPMLFPWRPATMIVPWVEYAQVVALGGQTLLDFVAGLAGSAALEALRRRSAAFGAIFALALLGPLAFGVARVTDVREERAHARIVRVGVVQPNVDVPMGTDRRRRRERLAVLHGMTRELAARGADVIAWPESSYPWTLVRDIESDLPAPDGALPAGVRVPLLFGGLTQAGRCAEWNTVVALDGEGRVLGLADKVRLFPFGDYVPFWSLVPWLRERFPCAGLREGEGPRALAVDGVRYGVMVCYDDVEGWFARALMATAPDVLVNFTNDAWYGRSAQPYLHELVARVRALETRRELVRAVNTGVSVHVGAEGRTFVRTATFVPAAFVAEVHVHRGTTPFVRFGEWAHALLLVGLGAYALGRALGRRRSGFRVILAPPWTTGSERSKSSSIDA